MKNRITDLLPILPLINVGPQMRSWLDKALARRAAYSRLVLSSQVFHRIRLALGVTAGSLNGSDALARVEVERRGCSDDLNAHIGILKRELTVSMGEGASQRNNALTCMSSSTINGTLMLATLPVLASTMWRGLCGVGG